MAEGKQGTAEETKVPRFVIVGGGTAGWLAALMLQDAAKRKGMAAKITIVESSRIPTIGVGEGTTAVFRQILKHFGFDEFEFIRETGASIKFGIRHKDWRRKGYSYDGPIDDPHLVVRDPGGGGSSWLDVYAVAAGKPVAEAHLFAHLMARDKSPFARRADGSLIAVGPFHHAYHFDQAMTGKYLRSKAKGVEILDLEVNGVELNGTDGTIRSLKTAEGIDVDGDFFIDCSGFRKRLIVQEMGGRWVSYADRLPVNRAMPFWVDIKEGEEIAPVTLAWAQQSGWLWSIPVKGRHGCGYVYSDKFTSPEQAQAEIETTLGHKIEPRNDLKFDIGRLDRAWIGNCLALGLSSSFLEPLEATSIHGTIVQLMIFTSFHLKPPAQMEAADRDAYNDAFCRQVDDFRDFINLHYVTEREDTPFWRAVRQDYVGEPVRKRLRDWASHMPTVTDFEPFPGGFAHVEQQLHYPVLDGLGLLDREVARREMAAQPKLRAAARQTAESLVREYKQAATRAVGHRAFLDEVYQPTPTKRMGIAS